MLSFPQFLECIALFIQVVIILTIASGITLGAVFGAVKVSDAALAWLKEYQFNKREARMVQIEMGLEKAEAELAKRKVGK